MKQLVMRDFKNRYRRSVLGVFWSLLNPLLTMMVLNLVFSQLFKTQIENYLAYLIVGLILFNYFSDATNQALGSVVNNASLITKVYVPKYLFPATKVFSAAINLGSALIAMYMVLIFTGNIPTWKHLFLIFPLISLIVFAMGVGLILSALTVFFRDVQFLYSVILMMWMYLTPIMYPLEIVPEAYQGLMKLNPLFHFIDYVRQIVLFNTIPGMAEHFVCLALAVLSGIVGCFLFKKLQDRFILFL